MLLEEVVESLLHSRQFGLKEGGAKGVAKPRTLENYRMHCAAFLKFMQDKRGRTSYEDLKRADVAAFVTEIQNHKTWSESTKLDLFRVVRMLFRFVTKDPECREAKLQPWDHLLPVITKNASKTYMPSNKELKTMQKSWKTHTLLGLRNYVVYNLILGTGLRIGEINFLKLEHVQLEQGYLYVPNEGKTGSRLVPIETKVVALLRAWIRRREKVKGIESVPWLFIGKGNIQCSRQTFGKAFRTMQAGLQAGHRITPHTLRHTFGTVYLRNGGNMERLRLTMGHTTYSTMQGYLHLAEAGSKQSRDELERVSPLKSLSEK